MSNKTELQANNIELQEILDSVNALPDAGSGGGSVETCTVTITTNGAMARYAAIRYIEDMPVCEVDHPYDVNSITINDVVIGSCFVLVCTEDIGTPTNYIGCQYLETQTFRAEIDGIAVYFFKVTG